MIFRLSGSIPQSVTQVSPPKDTKVQANSSPVSWVANNTEGSLKRAVVIGMVVGWGNLNGVVSSNIYITNQRPRYWTGHGVVLAYQALFLLGGSIAMHLLLRMENRKRRSGKRDNMLNGLTQEEKWIKGDKRPVSFDLPLL
jgi:hypothetical protein